ncbi:50S ribosomal protein L31 [[Brevibacterium] frigoritolerans]|uniref:Large ribosomal subunit protein bL31 n=1 Tax=Peribacillus frigoritolerans TaxID=450367 RepID=A0A941J700_9BACI|nr:50S ribosomal protein L31 [Peribacillus frigoritolerans]
MKTGIHPNYKLSKVICSCGNTFETGSVKEEIKVETCSECHPFYTGRQKFAEAGGRVDRFNKNTVLNKPDFFKNRQVFFLPVFLFP